MSDLHDLPARVFSLIESGVVAEFSTVSAAGIPIDTPTYYFPADDMSTIDLATGLPNPAKAERVRRTSKVGLLIEGRPEEPVVVIRAHGAVRDSDIQANAIRYLAETGYEGISHGITWEEARKAVTYWSRIIIENKPERVYWWDSHAALDDPPQVWSAAPDTVYPTSDPSPARRMKQSAWQVRPWQDVAREAVEGGTPAHLSVLDEDGFPLPMRVTSFELTAEGFRLAVPTGTPWRLRGRASLTFAGFRTFVGDAGADGGAGVDGGDHVLFRVERSLPQHPATLDTKQVLQPSEDTLAKARARLEYEAERRGQSLPVIPADPPPRTRIALIRRARIASDAPITGITEEHGNRRT
ncbi:pyridoxamine 5'-phosphate oxidase family protein [Frankia sp. Mgl5]|uniref:pyridoxamine 5'-phosphate oxidase family protein n=1 Tax=Frankia sp. Mgl5 TaxID=2933793 RepID=UPI00200DE29B|nr:pyridoxamine 5'-phosphate oxidase family protein [Frankia sp. Mgl5]MCK9929370.1 pyridoxamine 5'-phosphate oxidase family protein [Frankia sp. Mgl5]